MELFRILGTIAINNSDANRAIDETRTKAKSASEKIGSTFANIGQKSIDLGSKMKGMSVTAGLAFGGMIKSAANVKAQNAQFAASFGDLQAEAKKAFDNIAKDTGVLAGRLKTEGTKAFSQFKGAGLDAADALKKTDQFTRLAADGAAYYDMSLEETSELMRSFIRGNTEAGDRIGLFTSETQRNQRAVELLGKKYLDCTEAEKQMIMLDIASSIYETSGAMGQASREADGWENVMGNFMYSLMVFGATLGETILPAVTRFVQKATDFVLKFQDMGDGTKKFIAILISVAAAASPVLTVFGKMMTTFGKVITTTSKLNTSFLRSVAAVKNYRDATKGASLAAGVMNGDLTKSQAVVGGMAGSVSALKTNLIGAAGKVLTFSTNIAKSTITTISDTAAKTLNAVATSKVGVAATGAATRVLAFAAAHKVALIAALGLAAPIIALAGYMISTGSSAEETAAKITAFSDKLAGMITAFANQFPALINSFVGAFTQVIDSVAAQIPVMLPAIINAGIQLFMGLVQSLTQIIPALTSALPQIVSSITIALVGALPLLIQAGIQLFMGLVQAIPQIIEPLVGALPQVVNAVTTAIPILIPAIIQAGITLFMALIQAIPQIIPPLVAAIPQIINAIVGVIPVLVPALLQGAIQLFMAFVQAIPQIIPVLVAALPQIVSAVWNGLVVGLQTVWSAIKSAASAAWDSLKSTAKSKWEAVKSAILKPIETAKSKFKGLIDGIKTTASNVWNSIKSTASNVWNGIKSAITNPIETAKNTVKKIMDKIKGFFPLSIGKILDNIKLPHISVSGGKAPFGIAGKGSLPKFSVTWNAKGAIFDEPTIFATSKGFQGVGEAGKEAVAPIDTLQQYVASAVASQNNGLIEVLNAILGAIKQLDAGMYQKLESALDNRKIQWNDRELGRFVKNYA